MLHLLYLALLEWFYLFALKLDSVQLSLRKISNLFLHSDVKATYQYGTWVCVWSMMFAGTIQPWSHDLNNVAVSCLTSLRLIKVYLKNSSDIKDKEKNCWSKSLERCSLNNVTKRFTFPMDAFKMHRLNCTKSWGFTKIMVQQCNIWCGRATHYKRIQLFRSVSHFRYMYIYAGKASDWPMPPESEDNNGLLMQKGNGKVL